MSDRKTVTVAAAVIKEHDRFLLSRWQEGHPLAGWWGLPGGKVEPGETHQMALAREMREELGITVRVDDLVHMARTIYPWSIVRLYFYECQIMAGNPIPQEGQAIGWYSMQSVVDEDLPLLPGEWTMLLSGGRQA
jgi:8-oxo-dGTP diphosphatase